MRIEHNWAVIARIGLKDVRFLRPDPPEEPLAGHAQIEAIDMVREDRALVVKSGTLIGSHGAKVLTLVTQAYVRRRPGAVNAATVTGSSGAGG